MLLFAEGLGPLVHKLDSMALEASKPSHSKKRYKQRAEPSIEGRSHSSSSSGRHGGPQLLQCSSGGGWGQPPDLSSRLVKGLTTTSGQRPGSAGPPQMWSSTRVGSRPMTAAGVSLSSTDASTSGGAAVRQRPQSAAAGCTSYGGGAGSALQKPGSLVAAGILWQRTNDSCFRPPLRQCLTYEEMVSQE
jgi:hypothetical protein